MYAPRMNERAEKARSRLSTRPGLSGPLRRGLPAMRQPMTEDNPTVRAALVAARNVAVKAVLDAIRIRVALYCEQDPNKPHG